MHPSDIFSSDTLDGWLAGLAARHPLQIEMGLSRVEKVRSAMGLCLDSPILTVGGTNGKGSVCAFAEAILQAGGARTGCYTSPHLLHFGERVRVGEKPADAKTLIAAFAQVEEARARCEISLTYFEFTTLAAALIFAESKVDAVIMEVGLGGRLDAVNIFSPSATVVTNIALDHQEFLGDTIDEIAAEKAGIFRRDCPAIIADANAPIALLQKAKDAGAKIFLAGQDFFADRVDINDNVNSTAAVTSHSLQVSEDMPKIKTDDVNKINASSSSDKIAGMEGWHYRGHRRLYHLPFPAMRGRHQLGNAAAAICAIEQLRGDLWGGVGAVRLAMHGAQAAARAQILAGRPTTILDVAHNAAAANVLEKTLFDMGYFPRTVAVFGMTARKDVKEFARVLNRRFDCWYVAKPTDGDAEAEFLAAAIESVGGKTVVCNSIADAAQQARASCEESDRIVVTGSFLTAADYIRYSKLQVK